MAFYLSLRSYQPYAQGHFEWENEGAYKSYGSIASGLSRGFWIDPDLMPKSARQTRDKRLHDVIPMPGMNAVNQRFPEDNIQPALDWEKEHGEPWGYRPKLRASILKERGRLEL